MLVFMKDAIGKVNAVKWNGSLTDYAVCLSSEGDLSMEMAKILKKMPGAEMGIPDASVVLEINMNHPIADKLTSLFESDKDKLVKYAKVLYAQARLICGLPIQNPSELSALVCEMLAF